MFIIKKNYYLYIDNTKSINLNLIKRNSKIIIIYRNYKNNEKVNLIIKFRKMCKIKNIKFLVANNVELMKITKADGLYISAYNNNIYKNIYTIGSAHSFSEINQKIKQKCEVVILSRLFKTRYRNKKGFFGILKFNLINQKYKYNLIPLGGINNLNLLKLKLIKSNGFGILSSIKKKPVITNRLF